MTKTESYHIYPENPAHQPDRKKMWFNILPRSKNATVHFDTVEDTLAFAAFPAFHQMVFERAWDMMYGTPCTDEIIEHYRTCPEIQKQCNRLIETKTLKNGASLAEALLTAMRWEITPAQGRLLETAIRNFNLQQQSDTSPTTFDAEPETTHE
jgi:hypothetical protein